MGAIHHRHMITTDASMTGWGAVFEGRPESGEWKEEFLSWHINCLELRAVFLALKYFLPVLGGYHIIVRTDNMAVVSHINRQGGSPSSPLVPRQVPLFEGGSRSGNTEPGGRFSVVSEAQAGGMNVEPSDGIPEAAATTLRVYVAAIAARRELDEIPLGRHRMVSAFMRGVRRLRPVRPTAVPSWDLSVVLEGLVTAPFGPLY